MPYEVKKDGNKYYVTKKLSGNIVSAHDSEQKANAAIRAIYANTKESATNGPNDNKGKNTNYPN